MKLAHLTWPEVADLHRDTVVLIPTGSLEQHGPHLPLSTDSILVTAVAEAVEAGLADSVLLTPTVWQGASTHHRAYAGTISASFAGYGESLRAIIADLGAHGFHRFYVLNGHGGNAEPNGLALRQLKDEHPGWTLGHGGYYHFIPPATMEANLIGPMKEIGHACEAETSLMMWVRPELVRADRIQDDGLRSSARVPGLVWRFDELSERGPLGYPSLATREAGERLFFAATEGVTQALRALREGITLIGPA